MPMAAPVRRTASVRPPWHSSPGFEWSGELDSVLMGRREAGREELLERICSDQVRRWRRGQRVPAETYLSMYPGR